MAKIADRVRETSTSTGTGNITLIDGPVIGYRAFSVGIGVGNVTTYTIHNLGNLSEWETGYGTLVDETTLARTTVIASSNSGEKVNFSTGEKDVFCIHCAGLGQLAVTPNTILTVLPEIYGGTNQVSYATGDILYASGTNVLSKLGIGASGVYLGSSGGVPEWRGIDTRLTNVLINTGFEYFQRQVPGDDVARGDMQGGPDRWKILTESASVNCKRVAGDIANYACRLTQNQVSSQRMGLLQIIEGRNSRHLRELDVRLQLKTRISSTHNVYLALLEHTETEDLIPADLVNDWTSSNYSPGNFFINNLTVNATTSSTLTANTWTRIELATTVSSSCNNLIVFCWTEDAVSQNVTFDITEAGLTDGPGYMPWHPFPPEVELQRCQRYFYSSYPLGIAPDASGVYAGSFVFTAMDTSNLWASARFPVAMRAVPSVSIYSGAGGLGSGHVRKSSDGTNISGVTLNHVWEAGFLSPTKSSAFSIGDLYDCQVTADAEL